VDASFVIPFYNSAAFLEKPLRSFLSHVKTNLGTPFEVVAVNDGSRDDTPAILKRIALDFPELRIIDQQPNSGKARAVQRGISEAGGKWIIFTDGDFMFSNESIVNVLEELRRGVSRMIYANRRSPQTMVTMPANLVTYRFVRYLVGLAFSFFVKLVTGVDSPDSQAGLKGFDGQLAHEVFRELKTFTPAFDVEILLRVQRRGIQPKAIPCAILYADSYTTVSFARDAYRMFVSLWRLRHLNA
jgi:glycosyltransferase involved in cell wall biosynthesis